MRVTAPVAPAALCCGRTEHAECLRYKRLVNGGDHDGMPFYEICMKDKPIYYRPAPGYSFYDFLSMYPPKEIDFVDHGNGTADIESGMP